MSQPLLRSEIGKVPHMQMDDHIPETMITRQTFKDIKDYTAALWGYEGNFMFFFDAIGGALGFLWFDLIGEDFN